MKSHISFCHMIISALFMLAISGCAIEMPKKNPLQAVRLYVFNCGSIDVLDISVFHPGIGKGEHKTLANSCYLVVHPKGTLMWDTGFPDTLAATPEGKTVMNTFVTRLKTPLTEQFKRINKTPESVDYLGLSHMHFDHVGNSGLFPSSTVLMQKEEYEAAFGAEPQKYGFDPSTYPILGANPVKKLESDYDVFGDGTVVVKRALGHTPGHQALYLKLAKTGNILLSGDLAHFTDNWVHKRVPGFNFDKPLTIQTMTEVEQFLKANNAQLWIQHDPEQNAEIKLAPAYYE